MQVNVIRRSSPGLLVSVRSAAEATTALAGGAAVIDVKEPTRGSLGAADLCTVEAVVRVVGRTVPVTAAMGELSELCNERGAKVAPLLPDGVTAFKIGLAGCGRSARWQSKLREAINGFCESRRSQPLHPVGVAYADWQAAGAPAPHIVLNAARDLRCAAILVDTWSKSSGSLFDHWPTDELHGFVDAVRNQGMGIVLAGSLRGPDISLAASLMPDLVAVRAAACEGGRNGKVTPRCVRRVKESIAAFGCSG